MQEDPVKMIQPVHTDTLYKLASAVKKTADRTKKLVPSGGAITGMFPIVAVAQDYDVTDEDHTIIADATGGVIDVNLIPAADAFSEGLGRCFYVKRINSGANAVNVVAAGSETIDGSSTYALATQYAVVTVQSDGTNWHVI